MYRKMLVLLDGSELSEVVFPFAKELAARLNLDVTLLQVYGDIGRNFVPVHKAYIEHSAEKIRSQIEDVQTKLSIPPGEKQAKVRGELADGHYAEEILSYAESNDIDLILMASHGRSGIRRWSMGSVADKVLRASKVPVLFIPAGAEGTTPYDEWPTRAIVAPLDGSERAESVLPHVIALAKQRTIEPITVNLIKVCDAPIAPSYYSPELSGVPLNWGEFMEQEMARCKQTASDYLGNIAKQLEGQGIKAEPTVLVGQAAEEIIEYASKNPYSIVVMATHGRTGLRRLVFGSVTESVLHAVSNPILLTKPEQTGS